MIYFFKYFYKFTRVDFDNFFNFLLGKNLSGDNVGFRLKYFKVFDKIRYKYEGKTFF